MKKPTEAIDGFRCWNVGDIGSWRGLSLNAIERDKNAILAYLDSIPDDAVPVVWPKELTRERLCELAGAHPDMHMMSVTGRSGALLALAAIAPKAKKKRKVALWKRREDGELIAIALDSRPPDNWIRIGEGEIEE